MSKEVERVVSRNPIGVGLTDDGRPVVKLCWSRQPYGVDPGVGASRESRCGGDRGGAR